jgi:uncharacterized DUF497 family protein
MEDEEFEWDDRKAEANFRKHGVDFETATEVFSDHFAIEEFDPDSGVHGEDRYRRTGMASGTLVTVVYTERQDRIRIISARRATTREHDEYYRANSQE